MKGYWNLDKELLRSSVTFIKKTQAAQGSFIGWHLIPPSDLLQGFSMAKSKNKILVMIYILYFLEQNLT